jgi:hypothetical protein
VPTQINSLPIQLANPAQLIDRKADSEIIEIKNSAKFLGPVLSDPALLIFGSLVCGCTSLRRNAANRAAIATRPDSLSCGEFTADLCTAACPIVENRNRHKRRKPQ